MPMTRRQLKDLWRDVLGRAAGQRVPVYEFVAIFFDEDESEAPSPGQVVPGTPVAGTAARGISPGSPSSPKAPGRSRQSSGKGVSLLEALRMADEELDDEGTDDEGGEIVTAPVPSRAQSGIHNDSALKCAVDEVRAVVVGAKILSPELAPLPARAAVLQSFRD